MEVDPAIYVLVEAALVIFQGGLRTGVRSTDDAVMCPPPPPRELLNTCGAHTPQQYVRARMLEPSPNPGQVVGYDWLTIHHVLGTELCLHRHSLFLSSLFLLRDRCLQLGKLRLRDRKQRAGISCRLQCSCPMGLQGCRSVRRSFLGNHRLSPLDSTPAQPLTSLRGTLGR